MEEKDRPRLNTPSQGNSWLDAKMSEEDFQSQMKKGFHHTQTSTCKFIARDSYLAHLAEKCSPLSMSMKSNNSTMLKEGEDKCGQTRLNITLPQQTSDDLKHEPKQVCVSDRVKRIYKEFDKHNEININEIKHKLRSRNAGLNDEEIVYEKVLNSINFLIDIEKETKQPNNNCQVFNLLKHSSDKLNKNPDKISGVEESSCLKPSVFRKFDSKVVWKNMEWNSKFRKLKAYKKSKMACSTSRVSNVSDKIANFSRMEQANKTPTSMKKQLKFPKVNTLSIIPCTLDSKPLATISPTPKTSTLFPFTPETFSSPSTTTTPQKTTHTHFSPPHEHTRGLSPVDEGGSSTNISSEFEFNKRLINSSVECLLDPVKPKKDDDDIDPIANDNDTLLRKLANSISSSSLSSIITNDEKEQKVIEISKDPEIAFEKIISIHESPENMNFFPTTDKLSRFLTPKRKNKSMGRKVTNKVCSESKLKKDDWKEYSVKMVSESAHEMRMGMGLKENGVFGNDRKVQSTGENLLGEVDDDFIRSNSEGHLDSLLTPSQTNMPASTIFPLDIENNICVSLSAHKWSDGLENSLRECREVQSKSQTWSSDYYRTTWIANSNTSIGLLEDSIKPYDPELKNFDLKNFESKSANHVNQDESKKKLNTGIISPGNSDSLAGRFNDEIAPNLIDLCCEGITDDNYPENAKQLTESLRISVEKKDTNYKGENGGGGVNRGSMEMGGNGNMYCEASGKQKKKRKKGKKKIVGMKGLKDGVSGCVGGGVVGNGCMGGMEVKEEDEEMLETDV